MYTKKKALEPRLQVSQGILRNICPTTILMLKADSNYTQVFLQDGTTYLSSTTLGIFEKRLTGFNFFRLNRSVLINLRYLENFRLNDDNIGVVRLKENTQEILVSRRRKPLLINLLIKDTNRSKSINVPKH